MTRKFFDIDGDSLAVGDLVFCHVSIYEVIDFVLDHPKEKFANGAVKLRIFPRTRSGRPKLVSSKSIRRIDPKAYTIAKLMQSSTDPSDRIGQKIQINDTVLYREKKYVVNTIEQNIFTNSTYRIRINSLDGQRQDTVWAIHTLKVS